VDIFAPNGLFRAVSSFDFSFQEAAGDPFINVPTTILTSTGGLGLNGRILPGDIRIRQGGASFVENYVPGTLAATAGGTAGRILRADGNNASLVPSFQDRIFITSLDNFNPNDGTVVGGNSGNSGGANSGGGTGGNAGGNAGGSTFDSAGSDAQTAQRQFARRSGDSVCDPTNTVALAPPNETPDRPTRAISPTSTTDRPCTATDTNEPILKVLDNPPNSSQIQGLNSEQKIHELVEAIKQVAFMDSPTSK
jgi:hypothetical protein